MSYYQISLNNQAPLHEIFGKVMQTSFMTRDDRQAMKNAICSESITQEENAIINRLFYSLRRGFIQLID